MKKPIVDEVTFGSNKDQLFDAGLVMLETTHMGIS